VFFTFIYETEKHNGIAELLEILGTLSALLDLLYMMVDWTWGGMGDGHPSQRKGRAEHPPPACSACLIPCFSYA
jgi:hypothetical protein